MAQEIERKFLTVSEEWKKKVVRATTMKQGYLSSDPAGNTVRVRIAGEAAYLTIKGRSEGFTRPEFEYSIPVEDAYDMIELCKKPLVEKTRYLVSEFGKTWEVDVFDGANEGLVVAEIELESEGEEFTLPGWAGKEVSSDPRYYNSSLIGNPFSRWR
ncbi:CYTH domain-containing protein [Neolewinella aurantiaca]|uniref:CYTH domain-containing protein n=2 Tax=Neolewinella aurantiaca TaxID=2602767 RepID=A0A5C7FNQ9_9BACT|nr:CYTH domain-containing protein [Neolewinella aurantiaca]